MSLPKGGLSLKKLFFVTCYCTPLFLASCSLGLRPRSGPQTHIAKVALLANAEIAFTKNPSAENHLALGQALATFGRHESAIERYEEAVAINQGGTAAYSHLCVENNILKKWDEAIANCEKVLSIQPNHAMARNGLRYAQRAKAVEVLADSPSQINLGMQHYANSDWKMAISTWSQVPETSTYYATAQSNMSSAHIMLKDFAKARKAINEALRLEPNNELFRNNLHWLERESASNKKN